MAICKRESKKGTRYQVKVTGTDGKQVTSTFDRKAEAEKFENELIHQKKNGQSVRNIGNRLTVSEYFPIWDAETRGSKISNGWRTDQIRYFHKYVEPFIGPMKIQKVGTIEIARILRKMDEDGLSKQMQLHIYNLVKKMFQDAIELFRLLNQNPVIKKIRPKVHIKESRYLSLDDMRKLVRAVEGKNCETAVWLQFFAALRIGEVMALKWEHIDFNLGEYGSLLVAGTYVRKEKRFKEIPKGGKQRWVELTPELRDHLFQRRSMSKTVYVAANDPLGFLNYQSYYYDLKQVSARAGIPWVGPHGLRHSASLIYRKHGAIRDDMRTLLGHSSLTVTDRYMHGQDQNLGRVAKLVRLFPKNSEDSQILPKLQSLVK